MTKTELARRLKESGLDEAEYYKLFDPSKKMTEEDLKELESIEKILFGDRLKPGGLYKHYKGGLYYLEDIITHTETGERLVAYRALYGTNQLWCRPTAMFFGEIDHIKHPEVKQKYRFELQS